MSLSTTSVAASPEGAAGTRSEELIELEEQYGAHNYHPLPVVVAAAEGAWVTDVEGRRYLDCLAAYSALNFGHRHPQIVDAVKDQLDRVTLTSRAFHNDLLGPFCKELAALCGMDRVLPMNTGAEAVETGLKIARKWGYEVKGVPESRAKIVVMEGNFHGRTISIVSFSTDPVAYRNFGPYTPGFTVVKYGDVDALSDAIDDDTVGVLVEPIQGEAGVLVPTSGYLSAVRELCTQRNVLMIADEIQSGLGRTGKTFACEHEDVVPDVYLLGKALGGGVIPVSAVVANDSVMGVLAPGEHGSTFGGNPLACAAARAVVAMLETGEWQARAAELGAYLHGRLNELVGSGVLDVHGRGLWAGVDIDPSLMTGRAASEAMLAEGILVKDTHGSTIRFAPPIVVTTDELDLAVDALARVLAAAQS